MSPKIYTDFSIDSILQKHKLFKTINGKTMRCQYSQSRNSHKENIEIPDLIKNCDTEYIYRNTYSRRDIKETPRQINPRARV